MSQKDAPNRIRDIRKAQKMSQGTLGSLLREELTASAIAKIEKGDLRLKTEQAVDMANVLGVSLLELLGLDTDGHGVRYVPELGHVSAGTWQEAVAMSDRKAAIPGHLRGPNLFVLRAQGDSMDMIVGDGGYVVVDADDRELIDGKIYVIMNGDGGAAFKKFSADPLQLLPCSSNPAHKPIPLGSVPFQVVGRVVHSGQDH